MKRFYTVSMPIVLLFIVISEEAEAAWTFEFFGGSVYNFTTPLIIRQSGYDNIKINARYKTKPFELPIYYMLRIARWKENGAWEFEFIHQKLYLENKRPKSIVFQSLMVITFSL